MNEVPDGLAGLFFKAQAGPTRGQTDAWAAIHSPTFYHKSAKWSRLLILNFAEDCHLTAMGACYNYASRDE
jgi:hypothetical protein